MQELLSGPADGIWSLLGVLFATIFAFLAGRLSSKDQIWIATRKIEKDVRIHRERLCNKALITHSERMIKKLESAHRALGEISLSFSTTGVCFTKEDQPVDEFRLWYLKQCRKAEKIIGIIAFYLPQKTQDARKLYGRMNVFWGEMEQTIIAHAKGDKNFRDLCREKVFSTSREISELTFSIACALEDATQNALHSLGN